MQISARDRQYRKIKQGSVYQFMRDLFSDDMIRLMIQKYSNQWSQVHMVKHPEWMEETMDHFDHVLRTNPYSISKYTTISLRDLDARFLALSVKHPYHVDPDSQSRVNQYLMTELNRAVRDKVSAVLPYQKIMQDTWTVLMDNTKEYKKLVKSGMSRQEAQDKISEEHDDKNISAQEAQENEIRNQNLWGQFFH